MAPTICSDKKQHQQHQHTRHHHLQQQIRIKNRLRQLEARNTLMTRNATTTTTTTTPAVNITQSNGTAVSASASAATAAAIATATIKPTTTTTTTAANIVSFAARGSVNSAAQLRMRNGSSSGNNNSSAHERRRAQTSHNEVSSSTYSEDDEMAELNRSSNSRSRLNSRNDECAQSEQQATTQANRNGAGIAGDAVSGQSISSAAAGDMENESFAYLSGSESMDDDYDDDDDDYDDDMADVSDEGNSMNDSEAEHVHASNVHSRRGLNEQTVLSATATAPVSASAMSTKETKQATGKQHCDEHNGAPCQLKRGYASSASSISSDSSKYQNTDGLLAIAVKTVKLVQRNQLLQKRLAQLQVETSEFIASVLANPENRHFREKISTKSAEKKQRNMLLKH